MSFAAVLALVVSHYQEGSNDLPLPEQTPHKESSGRCSHSYCDSWKFVALEGSTWKSLRTAVAVSGAALSSQLCWSWGCFTELVAPPGQLRARGPPCLAVLGQGPRGALCGPFSQMCVIPYMAQEQCCTSPSDLKLVRFYIFPLSEMTVNQGES